MLHDIRAMRSGALKLVERNKAYSELLRQILCYDFYCGANKLPTLKEMATEAGIGINKARKYIQEIYHDLVLDDESRPEFRFSKVSFAFLIRGDKREKFIGIEVSELPVMPRVGEGISLPFFSAYLGTTSFFVEEISHDFYEDCQIVNLWLKAGSYNSYWQYRKDKAKEEDELHFFDFLNLDDSELKRKLHVGKWNK
ncbi:hypothetical protein [Pontibacter populi]|uniref:GntR family transcriptional regulator n=1 Tax=Pontibacter populi TaxID=890055 RepID=A0ABV1RXR2_9BACT